jgi:hypothetical protein
VPAPQSARRARQPAPVRGRGQPAVSEPAPLRLIPLLLAAAGVVLLMLAYAVVDWYDDGPNATLLAGSFADLRDVSTLARAYGLHAPLIVRSYFAWLAFALLIAAVLAVAATLLPRPAGIAARVGGAVIGGLGMIATCWAMQDLSTRVTGRHGITVFTDAGLGIWFCLAGYVLLGLAAGLGLRRI